MNNPEPCYDFKDLNEDISIANNLPCSFQIGQDEIIGVAEVKINFCPQPSTKIIVQCDFEVYKHFNYILYKLQCISVNGQQMAVFTSHISPPTSGKTEIRFTPRSVPFLLIGNKNTKISKVIFHLFNFKDEIGTTAKKYQTNGVISFGRFTEITSGKWNIELHPSKLSKSEDARVLQLTHIGCLTKSDKSTFDGESAHKLLTNLHWFFIFSQGDFCSPVLPVGFANPEEKVWALVNDPKESDPHAMSWFDPHHSMQLAELFPSFISILEDEQWQKTFQSVLYWYVRGNNTSGAGIDTGIILAQVALERLAYEYAVNHKNLVGSKKFKQLKASDKYRLLFTNLGIPVEIPDTLIAIKKLSVENHYIDSPHFLTEVRNSIVHPEPKKRNAFSGLYYDAWRLSLWYLELTILRLCDYEGTYFNRLSDNLWVGTVEDVPWIKKDGTKET
ncbi:MAG: hypothetical protein WCK53_08350 [Methanomicrobiales archaeon]